MTDKICCKKTLIILLALLPLLLLLNGCIGHSAPSYGGPGSGHLSPGLSVLYFDGKYRRVSQVPDGNTAILEKGRPGKPILIINHQFGQDEVFDSGKKQGVGVQMKGYIRLEKTGQYEFQALSNDGVEINIDGRRILSDPGVHSDRMSDIGVFTVQKPGWHPILAKYFQRKGTAALKFFWKTPGMDDFVVIPAQAYGHVEVGPAGTEPE